MLYNLYCAYGGHEIAHTHILITGKNIATGGLLFAMTK